MASRLRHERRRAAEALPAAEPAAGPPAAAEAALPMICAWCPDFDPKAPANEGATHGMCPACAERFEKGGR